MRTLPEYHIVQANNLPELQATVNRDLRSGWQCQGGIHVMGSPLGTSFIYLQAMVRYEQPSA